ncbi:asparagine synthase-related protein [Niallia sp. 01092]|uniref:asparagine synthase-related protein n=1 Tax=unclassified Niallia TaxID=2837522 RepID=UPI003FD2CF56
MSAIIGILHQNQEPISIEQGFTMMKSLQKYPADDMHTWNDDRIFLGCHSQWITPESIGEQIPCYDSASEIVINADAIIDNRAELFDMLQVCNTEKKTMKDSELIILAYKKWGKEAPKYLIGDFAFIIWDKREQLLFGARDFSGNRTLYYYRNNQRFAFSTIMEPLFSLPYIEKELNEQWLAEFLVIPDRVETTDPFSTVYKHIEQIPPAHTISVKEGKITFSQYCTLPEGEVLKLKSNKEYEEAFRDVYDKAVTSRLRTQYEVGAHLSGGLDSGSVVSFAANALKKDNKWLHTFSYIPEDGFTDWTPRNRMADERPYIESTVKYVGNINDTYLDFKGKSPLSEVDDWLEIMEMPYKFFENSFWMNGIYEQAKQKGIRVLLNGARGNWTVSWGPVLDYQALLIKKLKWLQLYQELLLYSRSIGVKRSKILSIAGRKAYPFLSRLHPSNIDRNSALLINSEFANRTRILNRLEEQGIHRNHAAIRNAYEERKNHFQQSYSWNINGVVGTKMSLRHSIWERDPTNDLRVVRFCLSIPEEQCVQNGLGRSLIRRSTKGLLPDKVRLNQQVRGIQGADGIHRMRPHWRSFIEELHYLCEDQKMAEYFNISLIKEAISRIEADPQEEMIYGDELKTVMRSFIVYRFLKNIERG